MIRIDAHSRVRAGRALAAAEAVQPGTGDLLDLIVEALPPAEETPEEDEEGVTRIAIVGRPNVGKSTLFNKIVGQKLAIVEDTPGMTRDRQYAEAEQSGRRIRVVDTGGFTIKTDRWRLLTQ